MHRNRINAMNATARAIHFTLSDFLAWEAEEPLRHEFIDG